MITAFFRTAILYLLLIVGLRLTGKRQIGELEPIELVLTMLLSDLASVPMQDFGIPLVNGVIPIITLLAMSMLLSCLSLRSVRFRTLICGEPALIIRDGQLQQAAMRHNRLTLDELFEELRTQGVRDIPDVMYAILESGVELKVVLRSATQQASRAEMGLSCEDDVFLPTVIINDGRLLRDNLRRAGRDEAWLHKQLREKGICSPTQVFLLSVDEQGEAICIVKDAAQ